MKTRRKIKLVIFDLDGTLINAYPAICRSFNYVMKAMGFPIRDDQKICRAVGWGERRLFEPFVEDEHIDEVARLYRRHHLKALVRGVKFCPGAKRLLNVLKKEGYRLAIASNRPMESSKVILRRLKIESYFDYVLCGDQIKKFKPHPEMLRRILKKFSLKPSQAMYVGDMTIDVEAGRRAKIKTVAVTTGSSTKREIAKEKPFGTIRHIYSVTEVLNRLNTGGVV